MNNETGDVDTPLGRFDEASLKHFSSFGFNASVLPVSYTHLTLPTILLV